MRRAFPNIARAAVSRDGIRFYPAVAGGSAWRVRRETRSTWSAWEQASPWRVLRGGTLAEISLKLAAMTDRRAKG